MGQPNDAPLFAVSNHYSGDGIEPPRIDGDDPNAYHSYFENMRTVELTLNNHCKIALRH